jgi:acyl-CoA reductase-like NAD-dependent aldehyde dehydrogenase
MDAVLDRAVAAQREWQRVPVEERAATCIRMATWMVERADEIGREISTEMGRPIAHSPGEIRRGLAERIQHMATIGPAALADLQAPPREGIDAFIRREPVGVVLVLAPWNYPYLTSVNGIVPALVAGNSVVLKVSSQTPSVGRRYAEAFAAAGLPEGVLQVVDATHDEVAAMVADERVGFVAFTGSVPGGHAIVRAAADRFVGMNLELGGKDPAYVRPDIESLERTVEELVDGTYFNAGQSCCAVERIYVHRDVYEPFVDAFVAQTARYVLGHPLDPGTTLGPMVRVEAADGVRAQIAEALSKGARRLLGSSVVSGVPYQPPTVLVDVDHSMAVMREESFGPVVGIMPVGDDDEAIALMNDSAYGLSASVWTADLDAGVRIGDRLETGTVYVNRCDHLDPALAWTGVKDSGRGVSLSTLAYDVLTRPKSFHLRARL